jgi:hypothetical protein
MPAIATPKIPACEPWTLTELLDHEKEVTGMFMSGHPLDHFKFEITHYGITQLGEFNEIKEAVTLQSNPGKPGAWPAWSSMPNTASAKPANNLEALPSKTIPVKPSSCCGAKTIPAIPTTSKKAKTFS